MTDKPAHIASCPHCEAQLKVGGSGEFRCPKCRGTFLVAIDADGQIDSTPATPPVEPDAAPPTDPDDTGVTPEDKSADGSAAACENHPGVPAAAVCVSCGKLVCDACLAMRGTRNVCQECYANEFRSTGPSAGAGDGPSAAAGVAWETMRSRGFFAGIGEAISGPLFRPSEFFGKMEPRNNLWRAFYFGILVQTASAVVSQILFLMSFSGFDLTQYEDLFSKLPPAYQTAVQQTMEGLAGSSWSMSLALFLAPLSAAAGILFLSLILHLFLLLFRGTRNGIEATIKVVSYSAVTHLIFVLPMCGQFVGMIWQIVILIIGLAKAHDTTTGRTGAAVLAPIIVCCILFALLASAIAAMLMSAATEFFAG